MNKSIKAFLWITAAFVMLGGAQTGPDSRVAVPRPSMQAWDAQSIVWQREDSDGTKWAVLQGDKDAENTFIYAFFIPAGYWDHHWHTQDARVAIITGALRVAQGEKLDKTHAKSYPAGSYLYVPANVPHTMGSDVDTIIIGTAKGPWKTHRHDDSAQAHHADHGAKEH